MSGHSKWHKIRNKKGKNDAARGAVFTKLCQAITLAARNGGDPTMNFALRISIDKAKKENVPKENIERAVKKGTGELADGVQIEENIYEGFGPGGVAFVVEAATDNKNRTVSEIKHAFSKHGGSLGSPGSVLWQFNELGQLFITKESFTANNREAIELALMDAGAEDIIESDDGIEVLSSKTAFQDVSTVFVQQSIEVEEQGLAWIPKETVKGDHALEEKIELLVEALEDLDDVQGVYNNLQA